MRRPTTGSDASRIRFSDPGLIRERVVDALREAIVAGRLKPGERIRERELVDLLGVSRSPLREAIRILETEGLITSLAHRGARVSELGATDLYDMLQVRIMLESFAVRLFMERFDEAVLQQMEEQVERARAAGHRVDLQANFDLGLEFHDLLVGACGNRKVVQLHENLKRHQTRYQHFAFARLGRDLRALDEHAEMVTMLRARDLPAMEAKIRAHLLRFYEYLAPLLPVGDGSSETEPVSRPHPPRAAHEP